MARSRLDARWHLKLVSAPFPLEIIVTIPGNRGLEASIHDCFAADFSHREWFRASSALVSFIAKLVAGISAAEAIDLTKPAGSIRKGRHRTPRSEDDKLCTSYLMRMGWADRKNDDGTHNRATQRHAPSRVSEIMRSWQGTYVAGWMYRGPKPDEVDLAIVEEYLSNPVRYGRKIVRCFSAPADPAQPAPEPAGATA